jgi:beta-glucosidase
VVFDRLGNLDVINQPIDFLGVNYCDSLRVSQTSEAADVRGYFAWSVLDHFGWSRRYGPRFGIVRVDYETLEWIPKQIARWYGDVISPNEIGM